MPPIRRSKKVYINNYNHLSDFSDKLFNIIKYNKKNALVKYKALGNKINKIHGKQGLNHVMYDISNMILYQYDERYHVPYFNKLKKIEKVWKFYKN